MEEVRHSIWEDIVTNQKKNRDSLLDINRHIERGKNFDKKTKEDVIKLATELKRKVTSELLSELKEILLQEKEHLSTFLEVDGALEALISALSGQNSKLQLKAAYCLCNLSLGDKYLKIIKIAGPYLILHSEGMNTYLIEACVWTLGNLSSHHKKCFNLLKSQGALPLLSRLLNHNDDSVKVAAAYALSHLVFTGYDLLTGNDFQELISPIITLFKADCTSVAYLISILSSSANCQFQLLQEGVHIQSLDYLTIYLKKNIIRCTWLVRIIGNLITETTGEAAIQILARESFADSDPEPKTLFSAIEYIFRAGQIFLIKECCWLIGNLINHQNIQVSSKVIECKILEKISNPVRYFLLKQEF